MTLLRDKSVRDQAAFWFTRMHDATDGHPDRARFEAWLRAHPEHAAEYAAFADLWEAFDSPGSCESLADAMEGSRNGHRRSRRRFLKTGAAALALSGAGGAALHGWIRDKTRWTLAVATGIGEVRPQTLGDGSALVVGADTRIEAAFSQAERTMILETGEAIFDVRKDPERPFVIHCGETRVTVLGTRFAVLRQEDQVRVGVERGRVEVGSGPFWRRRRLILEAGQTGRTAASGEHGSAPPAVVRMPVSNTLAFERGVIAFDGAHLSEVAQTLTRYHAVPVRLENRTAWPDDRITAIIQPADVDAFLKNDLPRIAQVTVAETPSEILLCRR